MSDIQEEEGSSGGSRTAVGGARAHQAPPVDPPLEGGGLPGREELDGNNINQWVVDMQGKIDEPAASKPCCIYQVPAWMKGTTSSLPYEPEVVSLGPFHNGREHLKPMENYKEQAMLCLVSRCSKSVDEFVQATRSVAQELEEAYDGLDAKWLGANEETFVKMMTTDGCFLLEMALRVSYAGQGIPPHGFKDGDRDTQALFVWQSILKDVVAIENQLPLFLLQKLELVRRGRQLDDPDTSEIDKFINELVLIFLKPPEKTSTPPVLALHPLDILYKCFCTVIPEKPRGPRLQNTMPCAQELSQAGIAFKQSKTRKLNDIEFINSRMCPELHMPLFRVHIHTEGFLPNLVAYETLHAGTGHVISSYLRFMDNIINTGADVALLRSAGVIVHTLGSDQAVADLFNTVYTGPLIPDSRLHGVQHEVTEYSKRKCNFAQWWAKFYKNYASDPLVLTSFIAAIILLLLTISQTFYTIYPYYRPRN